MTRTSRNFIASLADEARHLREELSDVADGASWWRLESIPSTRPADAADTADAFAQAVACCLLMSRFAVERLDRPARNWLLTRGDPRYRPILAHCMDRFAPGDRPVVPGPFSELDLNRMVKLCRSVEVGVEDLDAWLLYFFEEFLQRYDAGHRRRRGVFYTPTELVRWILHSVDASLREEFGLKWGLADTSTGIEVTGGRGAGSKRPFVRILDPAAGAGLFLVETIRFVRRTLLRRWSESNLGAREIDARWNDYVVRDLLPRLHGCEIMLPAALIAHFRVVAELASTGYRFRSGGRTPVAWADALGDFDSIEEAAAARPPSSVVIGNPPYCGISGNRGEWIQDLLRGRVEGHGGYYEADGEPLKERKLWLQDDYVKFLRLAQWSVESSGGGIVGFVTNHGYLDTPTFRGMRQQLLTAFPATTIVDLHGDLKNRRHAPNGEIDENVFPVETGVAIGVFRRPPASREETREVRRADLWGGRRRKLERLRADVVARETRAATAEDDDRIVTTRLVPRSPYYFLAPIDVEADDRYERAWPLPRAMPVNCTAPVTARDGFVVALKEAELLERLRVFRDLTVDDREVRRLYFGNTRSSKYPRGDTRGWKLHDARRRLAAREDWRRDVRTCQYRPFDYRAVFWEDGMIDWPRAEVTRHQIAGPNVTLIARRQMLPDHPCTFFWITTEVALDGIIRSDNRGSESIFPLYLYPSGAGAETESWLEGEAESNGETARNRRANFDAEFVAEFSRRYGLRWIGDGRGELSSTFGPEDLVAYVHALFHTPAYRGRYESRLRVEFPRVTPVDDVDSFRRMCLLGHDLIGLHCGRDVSGEHGPTVTDRPRSGVRFVGATDASEIGRGYPRHEGDRVLINERTWFEPVSSAAWEYRVGGHQVCRKWLRDRRGRRLDRDEVGHYRRIVSALSDTLRAAAELDEVFRRGTRANSPLGADRADGNP